MSHPAAMHPCPRCGYIREARKNSRCEDCPRVSPGHHVDEVEQDLIRETVAELRERFAV